MRVSAIVLSLILKRTQFIQPRKRNNSGVNKAMRIWNDLHINLQVRVNGEANLFKFNLFFNEAHQ